MAISVTHSLPKESAVQRQRKPEAMILGNGPSLRGFDLRRLARFDVFGMNAAYRYWYEIDWFPQYYACLDLIVGVSHRDAISELINKSDELGIRGFLLRQTLIDELGPVATSPKVFNFDLLQSRFSCWTPKPITTGSHTCAWASLLGYRNIYLLGIDCNYVEIVANAEHRGGDILEITKNAPNPNYFFDGYQQKGDKYNIPNVTKDSHLDSWRNVGEALATCSRVLNANQASRVDKFPFVRFEELERGVCIPVFSPLRIIGGTRDMVAVDKILVDPAMTYIPESLPRSLPLSPAFSYIYLLDLAEEINRIRLPEQVLLDFLVLCCTTRILGGAETFLTYYRENDQFHLACQTALRSCSSEYEHPLRSALQLRSISLESCYALPIESEVVSG